MKKLVIVASCVVLISCDLGHTPAPPPDFNPHYRAVIMAKCGYTATNAEIADAILHLSPGAHDEPEVDAFVADYVCTHHP